MIRALIVDDEPLARDYLRTQLADERDVTIVGECANGLEAVEAIRSKAPDVVFLDVQMPELTGFEVLEQLGAPLPVIVFVTAFDAYAIKAFDVHALDYLLKPFDRERFQKSLARAREALRKNGAGDPRISEFLRELERKHKYRPWILAKLDGRSIVLRTSEIDFVEASANYVQIHAGKQSYALRETMTAMEELLDPACFQRIHRSTIVNLDRIRELQPWFHGDYVIKLVDGRTLTLSRTYRERLTERLGRDL